jgi:hypothetical protein
MSTKSTPRKLASKTSQSDPIKPKAPKLNKPAANDEEEESQQFETPRRSKIALKDTSDDESLAHAEPEPIETETASAVEESEPEPEETEDEGLVGKTTKGVSQTGSGLVGGAKKVAGKGTGAAQKATKGDTEGLKDDVTDSKDEVVDTTENAAKDVKDTAEDTTDEVKETAENATDDVKETAEDATGVDIPLDLSILKGLEVNEDGQILKDGNAIGKLVEGDAEDLAGYPIGDDGEILDEDGDLVGRCELIPEKVQELAAEAQETAEDAAEDVTDKLPGLDILENLTVDATGNVLNEDGDTIGQLTEGNAKELVGKEFNDKGEILDEEGNVIGKARVHPDAAQIIQDQKEEAGEAMDEAEGKKDEAEEELPAIEDQEEDGAKPEGEDGEAKEGEEPTEENPEDATEEKGEEGAEEDLPPLSSLEGLKVTKTGNIINDKGVLVGELVEGDAKKIFKLGATSDAEGQFWSNGKIIGKAKTVKIEDADEEAPFAGLDGLIVRRDSLVEDENGNVVGKVTDGDAKKLVGRAVDEDGDILDKRGSVVGHAERYEEEEPEVQPEAEVDLSSLQGCTVNKLGNVVDAQGQVVGRITEGVLKNLIGKKVGENGQIFNSSGKVVGKAELVEGEENPEGPFSGFENSTVAKDGTVKTADGTIIGRVIEGDIKKLVGHTVDEDGDITSKSGNVIGKAERWEPEEKERRVNPMAGRHVSKTGEIRDENGDVLGRLTAGELGRCIGLEIDDNGYVVDNDGNRVGEVTLLENIAEPEQEEAPPETEEEKKKKEDAELAKKMSNICQQALERIQPVLKQITEHIEAADRTPKEELDEEELVNNVKPLIEEGARILEECNGALRALDPDGHIAAQAKARAKTHDATPEEYHLAELLKELTNTVVTTIDNAKKKISNMPHAKKKLNPLWSLLTEPLFQILAAVGLLLAGVLGLVGRLLSALGLGGLVNGLLGGLGIDKLLSGLGLGSIGESLGDGKGKKKGGVGSLPVVGGLLGSKS